MQLYDLINFFVKKLSLQILSQGPKLSFDTISKVIVCFIVELNKFFNLFYYIFSNYLMIKHFLHFILKFCGWYVHITTCNCNTLPFSFLDASLTHKRLTDAISEHHNLKKGKTKTITESELYLFGHL